jgi:hypothetical protein
MRHWQAVAGACWRRLPADLRDASTAAHRARAKHLEAKAAMAAAAWLRAHPEGELARRVVGEAAHG